MTVIKALEEPKLKNPVLIVGLPGIGNIGRVAVGYLIKELKAKKFAQLYSEHFFPFVVLHKSYQVRLLKNYFYYWSDPKKQRDIIFVTGDCQSQSPQGHYEVAEKVLDFVEKYGVKSVFTIGGLATGEVEKKPKAYGSVTHKELVEKYKNAGIEFEVGKRVGYIVGAAGLLLGLARERGMKGVCILGETSGFPIVTDPKAAEIVLRSLTKMLKLDVDMGRLAERVNEMEKFIKKIESLQRKAVMEIAKDEATPVVKKEEMRYIG
ncbi:MAG: proteasome assembly chaperone family protein [Candidatus Aenigmarchaeota archaeon]|nr:proteasome assembly chaperone family protein [Candidatus Aenigmarchaeota archaeon]